jgi:hypothetical protein
MASAAETHVQVVHDRPHRSMRVALAPAEIAVSMLNSARPSRRRCKCFDIDRTPCCGALVPCCVAEPTQARALVSRSTRPSRLVRFGQLFARQRQCGRAGGSPRPVQRGCGRAPRSGPGHAQALMPGASESSLIRSPGAPGRPPGGHCGDPPLPSRLASTLASVAPFREGRAPNCSGHSNFQRDHAAAKEGVDRARPNAEQSVDFRVCRKVQRAFVAVPDWGRTVKGRRQAARSVLFAA